jgi:predicted RNA-binding protein YlqC (UPF0109 family)
MKKLLEAIAKALVDNPGRIRVRVSYIEDGPSGKEG